LFSAPILQRDVTHPSDTGTARKRPDDGYIISNKRSRYMDDRSVCSLSDLTSGHWQEMKDKLQLSFQVRTVNEPAVTEDERVPIYEWLPNVTENEHSQREEYMGYLNRYLTPLLPKAFRLVDVANKRHLLDINDKRLPFDLRGGTDALVVESSAYDTYSYAGTWNPICH
jgi:hypothetical protein